MRVAALPLLLCLVGCVRGPTSDQPFLAVDLREHSAYPEAAFHGSLSVANRCLVLRQKGSDLVATPVLPRGTRLASSRSGGIELIVRDKRVALGKQYVFGGGFVSASSFGSVLAAPIPAACPSRHYIVSGVEEK